MPWLDEVECLDVELDENIEPAYRQQAGVEYDETSFINWNLQRWHDRAFKG